LKVQPQKGKTGRIGVSKEREKRMKAVEPTPIDKKGEN